MDKTNIEKYIYNNSSSPFKGKYNFLIINTTDDDVINGLKEVLEESTNLKLDENNTMIFYLDSYDYSMEEIIVLLNDDFGKNLKINLGFKISKETKGEDILTYYNLVKEYIYQTKKSYSSFLSVILSQELNKRDEYIKLIKNNVLDKLLKEERNKEFINLYFKNNLNVLKTSQQLYISRSSLLFRLKSIKKNYGIDLQILEDICGLYCMIN